MTDTPMMASLREVFAIQRADDAERIIVRELDAQRISVRVAAEMGTQPPQLGDAEWAAWQAQEEERERYGH